VDAEDAGHGGAGLALVDEEDSAASPPLQFSRRSKRSTHTL
jgi:hypothetical protein